MDIGTTLLGHTCWLFPLWGQGAGDPVCLPFAFCLLPQGRSPFCGNTGLPDHLTSFSPAGSCHPPVQTQCHQGRQPPSPLWSSPTCALCSVEERAGLFPPSSHENTHPFLPGRKIAVTSITQSHYYSLGGSNGRNIRPYIPPALRCPKTGLKTWVSGSLSSPCTVCGKLKGEKKIPRL